MVEGKVFVTVKVKCCGLRLLLGLKISQILFILFVFSKICGNVLLAFEHFILKNDEELKTFPASHFSEQR